VSRLALTVATAVAAIVLAAAIWFVLTEPGRQKAKANAAGASQIVAEGQAAAGRDAVAITSANASSEAEIAKQTQENRDAILNAPGAGVQLDPGLDTAARRAICMRHAARRDPQCVALLDARPR